MNDYSAIHILVPTDFSEHSNHALRYAASLGERFGATIHLVHVVSPHGLEGALGEGDLPQMNSLLQTADQAARAQLDRGVDHGGKAEATVRKAVVRGFNPWEGILEYAKENPPHLIVMGMHGGSRLARYLIGSVTERVLRFAPCPVLVVEKGDRDAIDPETLAVRIARVAVADDFSDKTSRAYDFIARWLAPYQPQLVLIHAVETEIPSPYVMAGVRSIFELDSKLRSRLETMMTDRLQAADLASWDHSIVIEEGLAHEVVPACAARAEADILVVAGESHIDLAERIMGGTVERMARRAPCPMLVV